MRVDEGESISDDPQAYAALTFMGGPMSVNDDLPWISRTLALIRRAVAADIPCLGHCLGGQLMSKALGGAVTRNPVKEIGWGLVQVADNAQARRWFGNMREFLSFHWHGETFSIPAGATHVLSSPYCANQAFTLGKHVGMQCHVEMTPALIRTWCRGWREERVGAGPSVQTPKEMQHELEARVRDLNVVADRVYDRWIEGLIRD